MLKRYPLRALCLIPALIAQLFALSTASALADANAEKVVAAIILEQLLKQAGPLEWRRAAAIFIQVREAMSFVHKMGVIHRDLKPQNNAAAEHLKILDFAKAENLELVQRSAEQLIRQLKRMNKTARSELLFSSEDTKQSSEESGEKLDALQSRLYSRSN